MEATKHPEWRVMYDAIPKLVAEGKTRFSYPELAAIGKIDVRTQRGRAQFLRFRDECLSHLSLWFENDRDTGYRAIPAKEHTRSASLRARRARRMTAKALKIAINTDSAKLSEAERAHSLEVQGYLGTMYLAAKETTAKLQRSVGAIEHPKLALPRTMGEEQVQ